MGHITNVEKQLACEGHAAFNVTFTACLLSKYKDNTSKLRFSVV